MNEKIHTVLLAHPDTGARQELGRVLKDDGFQVVEAHDGGRTLDIWRKTSPDLIVVDRTLARPLALDVVRRIAASNRSVPTSVLVLDREGDEGWIEMALAAGAADVCQGVSRSREFVARVRKCLQRVEAPPPRPLKVVDDGQGGADVDTLVGSVGFLERLVDCSGDAVIAGNRNGTIILFNRAAERVTGYHADEVVGNMSVVDLYYIDGMGHEVMSKLRSPEYGGVGKAGPLEVEIVSSDGEAIPINLHASILYDEGKEVATVGFFGDLRSRRDMEAKLEDAQTQLITAEKQAAVAELAGTAAHELNQPLAGIMGLAEMLLCKLAQDHPAHKTASSIQKEVDRLSTVVKKIGKITRYETRSYVGKARIVDLDRSSE